MSADFWKLICPWQRPDFHRSSSFEMGVARQQRPRVIQIIGVHADVSCKMSGQSRRLTTLSYADAIADRAAALERAIGLQLCEIWLPVIFPISHIVVHEKHIIGHIEIPILWNNSEAIASTCPLWVISGYDGVNS